MAKNGGGVRGDLLTQRYRERSTSENIYFPLETADIWEKSLINFQLFIYESEIFICSENWQKVEGK